MAKSFLPNTVKELSAPNYAGGELAPGHEVNVLSGGAGSPALQSPDFLLVYWNLLLRSKTALLLCMLAGGLAAFLMTLKNPPIYQSVSTLEAQGINDNFLNMRSNDPTLSLPDFQSDVVLQTQIRLLQSNTLTKRVLQKMSEAEPRPEFQGTDRLSAWRRILGIGKTTPQASYEQALNYAVGHVQIRSPESTRIIEIVTDSTDPLVARDFTNTLASEFIQQSLESRWKTSQTTGDWLIRQLAGLKGKLEQSGQELQNYAQTQKLIFNKDKESVAEEKLRALQEQLIAAESDRVVKQSRYEMSTSAPPEALPEVLDAPILREYHMKISELRRELVTLESNMTPANYKLQRARMQLAELQSQADKERTLVVNRITTDYTAAKRREELIRAEYDNQVKSVSTEAAREIHYDILKREVDTNRQLYDSMLQRVKEAGVTAAMHASAVRVVDPAEAAQQPYKPNAISGTLMGLLCGLFGGIAFVVFRDRMDRSLQSPGDAPMYLSVPELGVIPREASRDARTHKRSRAAQISGSTRSAAEIGEALELAIINRSYSILSESFRSAVTSILFNNQSERRCRVLVMTSPSPSEGKTTIVSNLALAMAEANRRVCLIDGDMRRPRLHDIFALPNEFGLRDVLDSAEFDERTVTRSVLTTNVRGLSVMPSGSPGPNLSTLLHSSNLLKLIQHLRDEYDVVLIDTPPMIQMPDARIIGRLADGVILVVRSEKTTRDTAQIAVRRLVEDGSQILGTILNDWNPSRTSGSGNGYGYTTYESGYNAYQSRGRDGKAEGA